MAQSRPKQKLDSYRMPTAGCCFVVLSLMLFITVSDGWGEFYQYVDEQGVRRFVDSAEKIPPAYRETVDTYKERYDHLTPQERQAQIAKERSDQEAEDARLSNQRLIEAQNKRAQEAEAQRDAALLMQQNQRKALETKVKIHGNQILVPVTVRNYAEEFQSLFLLDTGASYMVIFKEFADRLKIDAQMRTKVQVAGGKLVPAMIAELPYFRVGPLETSDLTVFILDHQGYAVQFEGIIGMNFLSAIKYTIDFQDELIRWDP